MYSCADKLRAGELSIKLCEGVSEELWCPVRDSNPHALALGPKPSVSTNSTNRAERSSACLLNNAATAGKCLSPARGRDTEGPPG